MVGGIRRAPVGPHLPGRAVVDAERLATTVEASRGFVYAASTMGVTGARDAVSHAAPELVGRVKAVSDIPVGVGLGVRSREQAAQIGSYADGVIVGSALVSALD